jgi:hypothetical protein
MTDVQVEVENSDVSAEIAAMQSCYTALLPLTSSGRQRVLNWVVAKLNQLRITTQAQVQAQAQAANLAAPSQVAEEQTPAVHFLDEQPE